MNILPSGLEKSIQTDFLCSLVATNPCVSNPSFGKHWMRLALMWSNSIFSLTFYFARCPFFLWILVFTLKWVVYSVMHYRELFFFSLLMFFFSFLSRLLICFLCGDLPIGYVDVWLQTWVVMAGKALFLVISYIWTEMADITADLAMLLPHVSSTSAAVSSW